MMQISAELAARLERLSIGDTLTIRDLDLDVFADGIVAQRFGYVDETNMCR